MTKSRKPKPGKQVLNLPHPPATKVAPKITAPPPIDNEPFQWSVTYIDHDYQGDWSWQLAPKQIRDLLALLEELSKLTWREVKAMKASSRRNSRQKHHAQAASTLCKTAQARMTDLELDEHDQVFRLRHTNLARVWGVQEGPVFKIIWYDENHKICPVDN